MNKESKQGYRTYHGVTGKTVPDGVFAYEIPDVEAYPFGDHSCAGTSKVWIALKKNRRIRNGLQN